MRSRVGKATQADTSVRRNKWLNSLKPTHDELRRNWSLGERNPATLPDGSHLTESPWENHMKSRQWRQAAAWALEPGGKYV